MKLRPNSAEAWYKLGVAKFRQTDAKLAFEKAIELKPEYAQAYVVLVRGTCLRDYACSADA